LQIYDMLLVYIVAYSLWYYFPCIALQNFTDCTDLIQLKS
jgi:hypothetical protein